MSIPPERDAEPIRRYETFTRDLYAMADWLKQRKIESVAMENLIRIEVAAAARRYQLALRSIGLIRTGVVDETESGLSITQLAYRLGNARLTDVILQQRSLIEAQLAEVSVRAEVSAAQAALDLAVGASVD